MVNRPARGLVPLAGLHRDGDAVLVAARDEENRVADAAQKPHVDVGREVAAAQVADVHGAVGIEQGGGDGGALGRGVGHTSR